MATTTPDVPPPDRPPTEPPRVRDLRVPPGGVLPRQMQTWLMVGLALVIVLIILITGHSSAPAGRTSTTRPPEPALAPAERIRSFEQQLADEEARQQQAAAHARTNERAGQTRPASASRAASTADDEASRRQAQSLFADNIALSRRPPAQQPFAAARAESVPTPAPSGLGVSPEWALLEQALSRLPATSAPSAATATPSAPAAPATAASTTTSPMTASDTAAPEYPASGERRRLLEGTMIESVLVNRLDGTFAGPVVCLVTTPVYTHDRQAVLIPAGARVLGSAAPVQSWGDSRLAVSFHRLLMPDGHTYSLNRFTGLNQIGEVGLRDAVNRHYLQVFGASVAIGALSGLAQFGTRSSNGPDDFASEYRQAMGASLATSATRVLDRYLNVLPTITIHEGARVKVYLTSDFELPVYQPLTGDRR